MRCGISANHRCVVTALWIRRGTSSTQERNAGVLSVLGVMMPATHTQIAQGKKVHVHVESEGEKARAATCQVRDTYVPCTILSTFPQA